MNSVRRYTIIEHYLLEIDDYYNGTSGKINYPWSWDVYIALRDEEYKGMAIDHKRNRVIPWTTLYEENYGDEINRLCQEKMKEVTE